MPKFIKQIKKTFSRQIQDFLAKAREQSLSYKTNNIMWTMGMDFHYMVASKWYDNMDILIKYTLQI